MKKRTAKIIHLKREHHEVEEVENEPKKIPILNITQLYFDSLLEIDNLIGDHQKRTANLSQIKTK